MAVVKKWPLWGGFQSEELSDWLEVRTGKHGRCREVAVSGRSTVDKFVLKALRKSVSIGPEFPWARVESVLLARPRIAPFVCGCYRQAMQILLS